MQHYRAALGEDGRGDSGSGDGSVVFEDGAARVVINKGARPESVDTTREKVDAEAVAHASESEVAVSNESEPSLEVRVLAAETAQKVAEAALGLAERQILHLRGNAHDANNSLVSVMGYLELTLMNDGLEGKVREDLEIVLRQATKVADLINRVMNNDGSLKLTKVSVELHSLIDNVLASATPFLSKNIRVDFASEDYFFIDADLVNVHGALLNLVKNAGEAFGGTLETNPDPSIVVRLSTEFLSDGNYAKIEVVDNGPGVPKKLREAIFEEGGASTKGNRGHGLGLPMVKKIVEAHGGAIILDALTAEEIEADDLLRGRSTGSNFIIYLPLPKKK